MPNPYFTHPSALYNQRLEFLVKLSECDDSKEFYDEIMDCKFDPIDYFYLERDEFSNLFFTAPTEEFAEGRTYYDIVFKKEFFDNTKYFKEIIIDGNVFYEIKY